MASKKARRKRTREKRTKKKVVRPIKKARRARPVSRAPVLRFREPQKKVRATGPSKSDLFPRPGRGYKPSSGPTKKRRIVRYIASPGPARWYRDLGRREARDMFPLEGDADQIAQAKQFQRQTIRTKQVVELDYLRGAVKRLRPLVSGFAAEDGFDLRHPERWSKQQADKVRAFSQELGTILAQRHIIVRPRSDRSRRALEIFTGQQFRNQKAWVVHVPSPDTTQVIITRDGKVQIIRKVRGAEILDRFYLFEEIFGQKPDTWDDIQEMTRILIGQKRYRDSYLYDPDMADTVRVMPKGLYTIWAESQGDTDAPVSRDLLMRRLTEYEQTYGNDRSDLYKGGGFEEVILGFHWQGTNREAAQKRRMELVQQRVQAARERKLMRARRRRYITRRPIR